MGRSTRWVRRIALAVIAGLLLTLAGCNTVEGAGRDVEDLGESVQDAAD